MRDSDGLKLYDYLPSGNGYKARLLLAWLERTYTWVSVDILAGGSRTSSFLAMNPNGRIPVLATEKGYLCESNAILVFLARDSIFLPSEPWLYAKVMEWLFFEQYSHEPFIATSRFWKSISPTPELFTDQLAEKRAGGLAALGILEKQLAHSPFLVGTSPTIADIALYAYTHVAHEGGFCLDGFPNIRGWLDRITTLPNHITIDLMPLTS